MPGSPAPARGLLALSIAGLTAFLVSACTAAPVSEDGGAGSATAAPAEATPTPTPEEVGLRDVDLTGGTWAYSPGGFSAPLELVFADGAAAYETISFTMGDPVYADVNGDGLEDALVAIESIDGNGYESLWYVFVADGDGAVQVPYPVARASRCGDAVLSTAAESGAFVIEQALRLSGTDDALACADLGTGLQRKVVSIAGDVAGGAAALLPVQTGPAAAWGGLCAQPQWLDSDPETVELFATPDTTGLVANPAGSVTGVFPLSADPWAQVPPGAAASADTWSFVGFVPAALTDAPVRLQCAFAPRA